MSSATHAHEPPAEIEETASPAAGAAEDPSIERLLSHVDADADAPAALAEADAPPTPLKAEAAQPGMRTARVVGMRGKVVDIAWRGQRDAVPAVLDEGVDREVVTRALVNGDAVLVEVDVAGTPIIVGVIQRRVPETFELKAQKITIEADQEVTLRAGRAAMRLRDDGDVELVGSRISTFSRGLFRIVGRVLRLN